MIEVHESALDSLKAMTEKLQAERDMLLAALKESLQPLELYHAYGWPDRVGVIRKAKSAIAKAE